MLFRPMFSLCQNSSLLCFCCSVFQASWNSGSSTGNSSSCGSNTTNNSSSSSSSLLSNENSNNSQQSLSLEEDEALGDKATKAAVLYANIHKPSIRTEFASTCTLPSPSSRVHTFIILLSQNIFVNNNNDGNKYSL